MLDSFPLSPNEHPTSLISTHSLDDCVSEVVILGTAFFYNGDGVQVESTKGRILCFSLHGTSEDRKKFKLLTQIEVEGGVYALAIACGRLIACVNGQNMVFKYATLSTSSSTQSPSISTSLSTTTSGSGGSKSILTCLSTKYGQIIGVSISTQGECVLIGDLLKSVSLYKLSEDKSQLEGVVSDLSSHWITATLLLESKCDASVIGFGGDNNGNLLAYGMDVDPFISTRKIVKVKSAFYLEAPIVKFITSTNGDGKIVVLTSSGAMYTLTRESSETFSLFKKLEHLLATRLSPQHTNHRQIFSSRREQRVSSDYFLDGNLLLRYLEIEAKERNEIAEMLGYQAPVLCSLLQKHLLS